MKKIRNMQYTLDCSSKKYRKTLFHNATPKSGWRGFTRILSVTFEKEDPQTWHFTMKRTILDFLPSHIVEVRGVIQEEPHANKITVTCEMLQLNGITENLIFRSVLYPLIGGIISMLALHNLSIYFCLLPYLIILTLSELLINYWARETDQDKLLGILKKTYLDCTNA